MAVHNSHANQFIQQLNLNERNSLRVLLLTKSGWPIFARLWAYSI